MKKQSVLFVCLGNICRSPAAEAIFLDLINKKGLNDSFIVDSAGTGSWHIGKKADTRMRICLLYTSPSPRDRQKSRMPSSA